MPVAAISRRWLSEGVSQDTGGGRLAKKSREVPEFWTRMWEAYILLVSSGMWEDLFQKDFHQSKDIKLTQIKQYQVQRRPERIETSANFN